MFHDRLADRQAQSGSLNESISFFEPFKYYAELVLRDSAPCVGNAYFCFGRCRLVSIPIAIPGISSPVKLGLAGGPIVIGILIGAYGPRLHLVTYTTRSANLMLRGIGLSLYLACLGLDAGAHFFETVMRPEGALWVGIGFLITFIPVVIMALVSLRLCKMDFGNTCGMLCGSMANPMALNYANDIIPGDEPSVSYATVYPLGMFTRVIIAQLVLMLFL